MLRNKPFIITEEMIQERMKSMRERGLNESTIESWAKIMRSSADDEGEIHDDEQT